MTARLVGKSKPAVKLQRKKADRKELNIFILIKDIAYLSTAAQVVHKCCGTLQHSSKEVYSFQSTIEATQWLVPCLNTYCKYLIMIRS